MKKLLSKILRPIGNLLRIRTLDVYIIKKFLGTYFFAIVLILAIIVMFDINEKLDNFMKAPLMATIFDYYVNFLPYMANQFSPLFTFIAVIFFTVCANGLCAVDSRAQSESEHHIHYNIVVNLVYKPERQLTPDVLGVFRALAEAVEVFRGEEVADKSLGSVNKLDEVCIRIFPDIFYHAGQNR